MKMILRGFVPVVLAGLLLFPSQTFAQAQGSESARRQSSWALFRTAAANLLRWNVGIDAGALPQGSFFEAAVNADALGVAFIEGRSGQRVSAGIPRNLGPGLSSDDIAAIRNKLRALNLRMPVYRVETMPSDDAAVRRLFEFARALGVETVVAPLDLSRLSALDKVAAEIGVNLALEIGGAGAAGNVEPRELIRAVEGSSPRVGIWVDVAAWRNRGVEPREGLALVKGRLMGVNLSELRAGGGATAFGAGARGVGELLLELHRLDARPLFISVSDSGAGDRLLGLKEALANFEAAIHPVMTARVQEVVRSEAGAIRGPGRLSGEVRDQIAAAIPAQAPAKPRKARKLLVMDLNVGYSGHATIPHGNHAIETMGRRTGAFEPVFSNDPENLKYPAIKQFDAIFLNNTVGQVFVDPAVREGLTRFVREGGGLGGLHGASYTSPDWREFSEMLGAAEGPHRVETGTLKIDDPASPMTRSFAGKGFEITDEFYRFYAHGPYSRDRARVLLSLDVEKSDVFGGDLYRRPDDDYGLSWIRSHGEGRVFYCALGHTPAFFTTPALVEFLFAGIQFVLGDLDADTTPSAKAR